MLVRVVLESGFTLVKVFFHTRRLQEARSCSEDAQEVPELIRSIKQLSTHDYIHGYVHIRYICMSGISMCMCVHTSTYLYMYIYIYMHIHACTCT